MFVSKLSDEQRQAIAKRFIAGETQKSLSAAFSVTTSTIAKVCQVLHAVRDQPKPAKTKDLTEFASRARSILWRQDSGPEEGKKSWNAWKARVEDLISKDGGGLSKNEAIVRASKEHKCLGKLFREFDVRAFDPNPESHAHIRHYGEAPPKQSQVSCENIEQSYRESLRWAMDAAGENLRTGLVPASCPCNQAWYLYEQAVSDPKDFLSKVGQIEARGDSEADDKRNARVAGARSIAEIDGMLSELELEEEGEENEGP